MTTEAKLLPCPFCGSGYVKLFRSHGEECNQPNWRAWCEMCGSTGNKSNKKKDAIINWNRRALPTAPPEPMSEEVKEALDCLEGRMTHAEGSDCECGLVVAEYIRRLHARSGAEQAVIDAAMNVKSHVGPNHRCSLECSVLLEMFDALIRLAAERRGEG